MIKRKIAIIGAGLTGLALYYFLKQDGIDCVLIEARKRVGGRIFTKYDKRFPPMEMGATWLDRSHIYIHRLLDELNLEAFPQKMDGKAFYEPDPRFPFQLVDLPVQTGSSKRIVGGSSKLIEALIDRVKPKDLYLDRRVLSIQKVEGGIQLEAASQSFMVDKLVSTLPPNLFVKTIEVHPELPEDLLSVMRATHMWMGESIRMAIAYASPFWREPKMSATVFSSAGPVVELYDHSDAADHAFALSGIINSSFDAITKEERLKVILVQLQKYYGSAVYDYLSYEEVVWKNQPLTYIGYDKLVQAHKNNGHSMYNKSYLEDCLFIAGTETAARHPGYMEGALVSALEIFGRLKN